MNRPDVTLVRHGQTEWSRTGKHTGLTDVSLTDFGVRQARALGGMLAGEHFELVQSSPLERAWKTMVLSGFGDDGVENDDLVEWDYGEHEGISTAEMREQVPDWAIWTHPVREGERLDQVGKRADRVIDSVTGAGGSVLLFGHGHFLRVLTARWLGLPPGAGQLLSLSAATVSTLGWERETPVVTSWNVECHLRSVDPLP